MQILVCQLTTRHSVFRSTLNYRIVSFTVCSGSVRKWPAALQCVGLSCGCCCWSLVDGQSAYCVLYSTCFWVHSARASRRWRRSSSCWRKDSSCRSPVQLTWLNRNRSADVLISRHQRIISNAPSLFSALVCRVPVPARSRSTISDAYMSNMYQSDHHSLSTLSELVQPQTTNKNCYTWTSKR